jgi:hypothetical protein
MAHLKARNARDTVAATTFTVTTHHVQVDLAGLLGQFDVTDQVVLVIETPSGRPKRVALQGGFLVPPHAGLDPYAENFA